MRYTLDQHRDGRERPFVISREDGTPVFRLRDVDERYAILIVQNLNGGVTLSSDDNDELARSA